VSGLGPDPVVTVVLPPLAAPVDELWHVLLDLATDLTVPWTLVGGQMILLHALEHGRTPPQVSQDGDLLADLRAAPSALRAVAAALEAAGFHPDPSPDGLIHRYLRPAARATQPVTIDVLAPEGLGPRTDLTTSPPGRTVQVPGGTQELSRTARVLVVHEQRRALVPRPTLIAAIVGKAAAVTLPGGAARHLRDLALLCALLPDPFGAADTLTGKDRQRIRMARVLTDPAHPAWQLVPADIRTDGQVAYAVLADLP
jgi:hypothetical protein